MARTSKTRVGGGTSEGMRGIVRATRGKTDDSRRRTEREEDRNEQRRRENIQAAAQAGAAVGAKMSKDKAEKTRTKERGEDIAIARRTETERQDIQMADKGLEREGPRDALPTDQPAGQEQPTDQPMDPRQQSLQDEMQRGERQGNMPMEMDGSRIVPSQGRKDAEKQAGDIKQTRAETEKLRVQATLETNRARAQKALWGDSKETYELEKDNYASSIRKMGDRADKIMKSASGDPRAKVTPDDISYIKSMSENNPDPELQQEVESGELGPASVRFLKGKMIYDSMDFVAIKGDWPDPDLIDEAHPTYQKFQAQVVSARQMLKTMQGQGMAPASIRSMSDANRYTRRVAAIAMKELARRARESASLGVQPQPAMQGGQQDVQQPGAAPGGGVPVDRVERPGGVPDPAPPGGAGSIGPVNATIR